MDRRQSLQSSIVQGESRNGGGDGLQARPAMRTLDTDATAVYFRPGALVMSPSAPSTVPLPPDVEEEPKKRKSLRKRDIFTFWAALLFTLSIGVGISYGILGPSYSAVSFDKRLPTGYGSGIYLLGVVESLDIPSRGLKIQWIVHQCEEEGPYKGCNPLRDPTNIYMNENATASSTFEANSAVVEYKANLTGYITDGLCDDPAQCWQAQLKKGVPYEQTMETEHDFSVRPAAWSWRSTAQAYPFDLYEVYATFLALDATGLSTSPPTINSRRIIGASMTGTIPNFTVRIKYRDVVSNADNSFRWLMVSMSVQRAEIVIGFAFLIWLVNWLMTAVVMWITISAVQGRRKIPEHLFAVPIAALFALPSVRQSMPASPAFGQYA
ncbi:hypothetical protein FRC03_003801 [Tulasnella sp. 419]|nr:hypothetical protein FRC03_003801 [Tulasnella sp. 419]